VNEALKFVQLFLASSSVGLSLLGFNPVNKYKKIVNGWLHAHFNEHLPELRLIESVLFLSMLPYHSDRPLQQEALLLRGLELFASWSRTSKSMQTGAGSQ
jgi:hypothetical protein